MMEITIKEYIEEHLPKYAGRIFPVMTKSIEKPSIVYSSMDINAGHVNQSQLTLTVIWSDYDECLEIHDELKELLAMEEDESFVSYKDIYLHSELSSGGGQLFNGDAGQWEISKYYMIDWRKKNGKS